MRAALELHELGTRDLVGEHPALVERSGPVSAPVQHERRRLDLRERGTHVQVVGELQQRDRCLGRGGSALVAGEGEAGAGIRIGCEEIGEQV